MLNASECSPTPKIDRFSMRHFLCADVSLKRALAAALTAVAITVGFSLPVVADIRPLQGNPLQGTHQHYTDTRVAGFLRSYLVHIPKGYTGRNAMPVVVGIHGAFSSARKFAKQTGINALADREGFIAIYPNGIGLFGLFRHWNAGHCCGKALDDDIDDVEFVMSVIEDVGKELNIDKNRIYLIGHSNGAMLAYRIAAERSGAVAAVAAIAGSIGGSPVGSASSWRIPRPKRTVPVLSIHGRADRRVPYDGSGPNEKYQFVSVNESIRFWIDSNGCGGSPVIDGDPGSVVEQRSWCGRRPGSEVTLVSLEGWGHDWPGLIPTGRSSEGSTSTRFEAAETAWRFFKRHRRSGLSLAGGIGR